MLPDAGLLINISVLLAIGLLALLVIVLVARGLGDSRMLSWLKAFQLSPVLRYWKRLDRELAAIPELSRLDPRERREIYLRVSKSFDRWRFGGACLLGLLAGMGSGFIQSLAQRAGEPLLAAAAGHPPLDRIPPY